MKQAYIKGRKVTGICQVVTGVARISGWDKDGFPVWTGDTEMDWDSQRDMDGGRLLVCEDDTIWAESHVSVTFKDE